MSLYSDTLPKPQPRPDGPAGQLDLNARLVKARQATREKLQSLRKATPKIEQSRTRLTSAGREAAVQARKRPIMVGAAVAAAGIGLTFLLSPRARTAAGRLGREALSLYRRRR